MRTLLFRRYLANAVLLEMFGRFLHDFWLFLRVSLAYSRSTG